MPKKRKKKEIPVEEVLRLRDEENMSWSKIAEQLKCTRSGCYQAYKRVKLERGEVETKKEPTTPWDANSNPWARDMLALKKKHDGFRPRFVANDPENIERKLMQGWRIADLKDYGGLKDNIVGEEKQINSQLKRRELILMELPEELGKKRDEFINRKTDRQSSAYAAKVKQAADALREQTESDPQLVDEVSVTPPSFD